MPTVQFKMPTVQFDLIDEMEKLGGPRGDLSHGVVATKEAILHVEVMKSRASCRASFIAILREFAALKELCDENALLWGKGVIQQCEVLNDYLQTFKEEDGAQIEITDHLLAAQQERIEMLTKRDKDLIGKTTESTEAKTICKPLLINKAEAQPHLSTQRHVGGSTRDFKAPPQKRDVAVQWQWHHTEPLGVPQGTQWQLHIPLPLKMHLSFERVVLNELQSMVRRTSWLWTRAVLWAAFYKHRLRWATAEIQRKNMTTRSLGLPGGSGSGYRGKATRNERLCMKDREKMLLGLWKDRYEMWNTRCVSNQRLKQQVCCMMLRIQSKGTTEDKSTAQKLLPDVQREVLSMTFTPCRPETMYSQRSSHQHRPVRGKPPESSSFPSLQSEWNRFRATRLPTAAVDSRSLVRKVE